MDAPRRDREQKKRSKSRSHLVATTSEKPQMKETAPPSASRLPRGKHRYANSTGRSIDWEDIIRGELAEPRLSKAGSGEERSEPAGQRFLRFGLDLDPVREPNSRHTPLSKTGDIILPKSILKKRTAVSSDLPSVNSEAHSSTAVSTHSQPADDLENSDASDSSIVIHEDEPDLKEDEEMLRNVGATGVLPSALHLDLSHLKQLDTGTETDLNLNGEPKLRAHAVKPRVSVVHSHQVRAYRKAVGSSFLNPIMGDNPSAFVMATIEAMYFSGHTLCSQKLMQRYSGLPAPSPLLTHWPLSLKMSLSSEDLDLDGLDDDLEEDEGDSDSSVAPSPSGVGSPGSPHRSSANRPLADGIVSSSRNSSPSLPLTGGAAGPKSSMPSSPTNGSKHQNLAQNPRTQPHNADFDPEHSKLVLNTTAPLKASGETSKRSSSTPNTGLLSGIINKIRRNAGSPAPYENSQVPTPPSAGSPGHNQQQSPLTTSQESMFAMMRKKFRPWDRLRRLRSSDGNIPAPDDAHTPTIAEEDENSQSQSNDDPSVGAGTKATHTHPGANELRIPNLIAIPHFGGPHLTRKEHARTHLSTALDSEAIRGPYFQRLRMHSAQMARSADNIDYLHNSAKDDLDGVNKALGRMSSGYDALDVRCRKLSRQVEDTKQRSQSANALLLDNINKTVNTIHYLDLKQKTKPPMKALLAVLGWLVLLVGTLIWLFTATYRAVLRGFLHIRRIFSPRPTSHPTRRQGSIASDPGRAMKNTLQSSSSSSGSDIGTSSSLESSNASIGFSDLKPSSESKASPSDQSGKLGGSLQDAPRQNQVSGVRSFKSNESSEKFGSSDPNPIDSFSSNQDPYDSENEADHSGTRTPPPTPDRMPSSPVQLGAHQLQTLEDMSKSIKAMRQQEMLMKRKAAAERARKQGMSNE